MGRLSLRGSTSTTWSEAAIVLTVFSLTLCFFALIGTEWAIRHDAAYGEVHSYGLWHSCTVYFNASSNLLVTDCISALPGIDCGEGTLPLGGWHVSCQVLFPLGTSVSVMAVVILIIFQCCSKYRQTRALLITFISLQILASILMMVAIIAFGQHGRAGYPDCGLFQLDWSFDVAASTTGLTLGSVILAVIQLARFSSGFGETQRLRDESETAPSGFDNVNVVQMSSPAASTI